MYKGLPMRAKPTSHVQLDPDFTFLFFLVENCHQPSNFSFHFLCVNEGEYSEASV